MDIETIYKKHEKTVKWFQIVKVESEYPPINYTIFKDVQNRFLDKNTFIDAVIDDKNTYFPFYSYGTYFSDYPDYSKQHNLKWIAKVYAVKDNKKLSYICGYKWGFKIINKKVLFIYPTRLNETNMFDKYVKIIKNHMNDNR